MSSHQIRQLNRKILLLFVFILACAPTSLTQTILEHLYVFVNHLVCQSSWDFGRGCRLSYDTGNRDFERVRVDVVPCRL